MDFLLPVLLPCPLCSAQQQLSAQSAALHLWKQENSKTTRKPRRHSSSLNDLSSSEPRNAVDGIYRAEPYFIENVGEVETLSEINDRNNKNFQQRSQTLPILRRRNSRQDRYSEFLKLCEHVECLVDLSVQKSGNQNNMQPSKALTRKTRKTLIKENEKGDKNIFLQNSRNTSTRLGENKENMSINREILLSDDLLVRSLRDANNLRSPLPLEGSALQTFMQKHQNNPQNYYVWTELDKSRYRSRFFPMRKHDLVRDDMAFRSYRKNNSISSLEQDVLSKPKVSSIKNIPSAITSPKSDQVSLLLCQKDIYESQEVAVDVDEAIKRYKYDKGTCLSMGAGSPPSQKNLMDGEHHSPERPFRNPNSPSHASSSLQKMTIEEVHHPHSILISSLPPIPPPRRRDRSRSKNRKENRHQKSSNSSDQSGKKSSSDGRNSQKSKSSSYSSGHQRKHHQTDNGKSRMKNNPIFPGHKLVVRHHSR